MGLTLLEAGKSVQDRRTLAVIKTLTEDDLFRAVPFKNITGGGVFYAQEAELPGVGWRGVNEGYDSSFGVINPQSDPIKPFGGDVVVDRFLIDTQGPQVRGQQVEMKVRAMRGNYADTFINGGLARNGLPANPREMDGLKRRINSGSSQLLENHATGAGLSLAALDELLDAVDAGGGQKYLFMPKALRRRVSQAARDPSIGGNINFEKDEFGYQYTTYGGARIITTDVNEKNLPIQPFNEGAGTDCSSVYCVAFGDMLVTGIQGAVGGNYGISVRNLTESLQAPAEVTRIEWYIGMAVYSGRAAARLTNVQNVAVTA